MGEFVEDWDIEGLMRRIEEIFTPSEELAAVDPNRTDREDLITRLQEEALAEYDGREEELGEELLRQVERYLLLEIIDQRWQEHLNDMDYLQQGIHLRGFAQIEPLVAYKNEAFELFRDLMNSVWEDFARLIFHVEVTLTDENGGVPPPRSNPSPASSSATGGGRVSYSGGAMQSGASAIAAAAGVDEGSGYAEEPPAFEPVQQRIVGEEEQIGRNDPCWCGSGKKFKKCHGAWAPGSESPAAAVEDRLQGSAQIMHRVGGHRGRSPGDVGVGAHEHAAVLADLAQTRPVLVEIGVAACGADDVGGDLDPQLAGDPSGGARPRLAGDAGQQREAALAGEVVGAHAMPVLAQPAVRQARPGPGRGVVVQLGVAGVGRLGRSVRHDGA
jgi:hypothetical protein